MASPIPTRSEQAGWQHFSHVADIGIHGFGPTICAAFEQAALALCSIVTELKNIREVESVTIECQAPDFEILLVDWLNAIVFEMATRNMLFSGFQVEIEGHALKGRATGEYVSARRHQPAAEVKGATFSELSVFLAPDRLWHARCIVDV